MLQPTRRPQSVKIRELPEQVLLRRPHSDGAFRIGLFSSALREALGAGTVVGLTDRQLLEQFNAARDLARQAAFTALVRRHGPMVLGLCTKLLHDKHHAEDAFQAVFLVLARRAPTIRDPDLLANWLYGVSLRTARHAKARLRRRREYDWGNRVANPARNSTAERELRLPSAEETALAREQTEGLHQEIHRLPKVFRLVLVLRYFEGKTIDEIACRLNWPVGTVRSRLARAREKLRVALGRRGLALPVAAPGWAASGQHWASASVSAHLCDTTTVAAMNFVAGRVASGSVTAVATSLARKVLQSMLLRRTAVVALMLLLSGALIGGGSYLTSSLASTFPPQGPPVVRQSREQVVAKTDGDALAPGRMLVTGRVLDPGGKPVAGATIMAYARGKIRRRSFVLMSPAAIGEARSDESGRFRLEAARTGSSEYDTVGAIATAPGYGAAWVELNPDAEKPQADITLLPEQVIHGRLLDVHGRPAPQSRLW